MAQDNLTETPIALDEACELLWKHRRELLHARAASSREDGCSEERIVQMIDRLSARLWAGAQQVLRQRINERGCSLRQAALGLHRDGFFRERDLLQVLEIDRWELESTLEQSSRKTT